METTEGVITLHDIKTMATGHGIIEITVIEITTTEEIESGNGLHETDNQINRNH